MHGILGAWLALCTGLLFACRGPEARPDADVVLITVDTLRADRVGLLGASRPTTPALDRFFAGGRAYSRAYSAASSTSASVATVLSGLLPPEHRVRFFYQRVPDSVKLITDLLPAQYQRAGFVSNMVLTDEAMALGRRFDHYDDFVDERESGRQVFERRASRTTDAVLAWLAHGADPARPLFLWVHYIDPHGPYRPPSEWRRSFTHPTPQRFSPERLRIPSHALGSDDALDYVDAYDEEVAYTDAEIGRLLEALAERRKLDQALVIFSADHGETLTERALWFTHGNNVYEELVRVPLLLRGPGVEPGRSDLPAHGTDIAPTILRFLGLAPGPGMPDVDLRSGRGLAPDRLIVVEATDRNRQWRGTIRGDQKWVVRVRGEQRSVLEGRGYALDLDPGERKPLELTPAEGGAEPLLELIRSDPDPAGISFDTPVGTVLQAPKLGREVSPEDLERLRALGYVDERGD